ncbi:7320_t:CDS:2 [Funneliformis caledonium]|uniref:7320_t:CDS:1 n=1 Tax=Funneliformis caledonium TaxID=1117310 RepID=A0A9N8W0I9_9GLOM|nr:7320_t:CDS:2 [Funneliformis caledonium]
MTKEEQEFINGEIKKMLYERIIQASDRDAINSQEKMPILCLELMKS